MYREDDYRKAASKMKTNLWIALLMLGVTIGAMCVGIGIRNKWLATISPVVGCWILYTWWSIKFLPWLRYNRFLGNMRNGKRRETDCYYMDASDEIRIVDGVQIHDFNASLDEAGEDVRLFYWDGDKPMPEFKKGQRLHIVSYGNFITDCAGQ